MPLNRGVNRIKLQIGEKPSCALLPNGDTRSLLFGLANRHLEDWQPQIQTFERKTHTENASDE
jgi:hypothetical protein